MVRRRRSVAVTLRAMSDISHCLYLTFLKLYVACLTVKNN